MGSALAACAAFAIYPVAILLLNALKSKQDIGDNLLGLPAEYLIVVLPIVALFLLMQERFIQGMAAGGMKG